MSDMWSSDAYATFTVAFAVFTDTMIHTLTLPFLPDLLMRRLRVPEEEVAYWTTLSFMASAVAALVSNAAMGYITEGRGSKTRPFMLGVILMLASTLVFFLGLSPILIIISRAIQGASTTLVWVSGLAFLISQVGEDKLGEYVGFTTVGVAIGEVGGPLLGGPAYNYLGHWAIFGVVEVLLAIDIILRLFITERNSKIETEGRGQLFIESDPLLTNTQPTLIESGSSLEESRFSREDIIGEGEGEVTQSTDLVELQVVRAMYSVAWNWVGTVLTLIVIFMIRGALEVAIPLYVIRQYSWTPREIGLVMITLLLPAAINPVIGKFTSRFGPRWFSVFAFITCGVSMICFGSLVGGTHRSQVLFVVFSCFVGVSLAVLVNANQVAISVAAQRFELATAHNAQRNVTGGALIRWLTSGKMLAGVTFSWSAGVLLGSAYTSMVDYSHDGGWALFCHGLGILAITAGICNIFLWKKW